jgi:gluconolactonase
MRTSSHRPLAVLTVVGLLVVVATARAQQQPPPAPTETTATSIPGVIAAGTKIEVIKSGFTGTEGPIGLPDGSLIFTETQANRITRIDKDTGATTTFLENTNGSNGLAWDSKGRLLSVQTTPGAARIGVIYPKGSETTITDSFEGKPYGRPNDLVVSKAGHIYFTEPGPNPVPAAAAGGPPSGGASPALPPAVYHVSPAGKVTKVAEGIERPNGIMLSPDEKTLYVNNTSGEHIIAFDVAADGSTSNRRNFAKYATVNKAPNGTPNSGADGLAIDAEGRLYCAAIGGVQVFSPKGEHLGTIPTSLQPQNIAFAGPDKKTLYIVGRGSAFKVRVLTAGFAGRAK